MMRLVGICTMLLAAAVALGPLTAGDNGSQRTDADAYFLRLDSNKDGRLSKDEFLRIAEKFRDKEKARASWRRPSRSSIRTARVSRGISSALSWRRVPGRRMRHRSRKRRSKSGGDKFP